MHCPRFFLDPGNPPARARALARPSLNPSQACVAAFGCALALLTTPACGKKHGSPTWTGPGDAGSPPASTSAARPNRATGKPSAAAQDAPSGLRFIAYNVENWLTMDRSHDHTDAKGATKPAAEKRAVIQLLTRQVPDVLGICEIGTRDDLAELQAALQTSGVELPHSYYTGGGDELRHLGLLSRFPITSTLTPPPAELDYKLNGAAYTMSRGILDATIQANGKPYRLLGVHLKSKREVADGDQDAIRLCEARVLRHHVDTILTADAGTRLIVYGDFNDTRGSAALKIITGNSGDATGLTSIPVHDTQGERWTQFWALQDIYSRFDFITVSQSLKHEVDATGSRIIDDPEWAAASDHRALLAVFN